MGIDARIFNYINFQASIVMFYFYYFPLEVY
jgi:hypothetical protein